MTNLIRRLPRIASCSSSFTTPSLVYLVRNRPLCLLTSRSFSTSAASLESPIEESTLSRPIDRSHETPDVKRARLLYQSRKRGILETDLLLSTFAHKYLSAMSEAEMREYDNV
jgi:succinate dehydrogenase assembly factor 2